MSESALAGVAKNEATYEGTHKAMVAAAAGQSSVRHCSAASVNRANDRATAAPSGRCATAAASGRHATCVRVYMR